MEEGLTKIEVNALKEQFESSPIFHHLFTTNLHHKGHWDDNGMWKYNDLTIARCFIAYCEGAITGALTILGMPEVNDDWDDDTEMCYRMAKQMEEEKPEDITIDLSQYLS